MEEKTKFDHCYFETSEGRFLLLNTESKEDEIKLLYDIIYIKRHGKLFEEAIRINTGHKFEYLGPLLKIDHQDIFDQIIRYNLVEYSNDNSYLWRTFDALLNTKNITILSNCDNYRKFENPHIFKIINGNN